MKASIINDIAVTVAAFYANGGKIEINYGLPYVAITQTDGEEWFIQNEEADNLLEEIPEDVNDEHYIIWISQGW